ncbi:MAG: transglycosylase domain-containing protein [Dongiaceae bacterium]
MANRKPTRSAKRRQPEAAKRRIAQPRLWRNIAKWTAVAAIWALFLTFCFAAWLAFDLPDVDGLNEIDKRPSVTLLDRNGDIFATYGDLYGETVQLAELPVYLPQAVLSMEDRRFYDHSGVDPRGLARAVYTNIAEWDLVQGGSTITQQLAKNIFLTHERTLRRKGQELMLSIWLERHFTKDEILTLYLNRIYFGAGTYGVEAASQRYFGKSAREVTAYEAAMLAGMIRAPSRYNPISNRELAEERARIVLGAMADAGYLSEGEATAAAEGSIGGGPTQIARASGQYFADWVMDQLPDFVGLTDRDLIVETTLDPRLQSIADEQMAAIVAEQTEPGGASQGALITMTPDGAVRALVGGLDYRASQFNRATQALRQPGSAFKAFVYLAAFESGLQPDSLMFDGPVSIGGWTPANYEDRYYGEVTLREAMARSLNSVAAQLVGRVGADRVVEVAQRLGIGTNLMATPSIALGTSEVTLVDLTGAYATFVNQGRVVLPRGIERVRMLDGTVIYERSGSGAGAVVAPQQVAQMQDVLAAVIGWGSGKAADIGRPSGGKTGTGQDYRDAWFVGFTAELVTGVWFGNDDNRPMTEVTGGRLPARLWAAFMAPALEGEPVRPLPWGAAGEPQIVSAEPLPEPGANQGIVDELSTLIDSLFAGGNKATPEPPSASGGQTTTGPASTDRERKSGIVRGPYRQVLH